MNFGHSSMRSRVVRLTAIVSFLAFGAFIFNGRSVSADGTFFAVAPGTPFLQNWTTTGQVTTDDNWAGVPSIVGFRGDDLTTVTATDPQTILADGSGTPVDVIANQANPNTQATGGVGEFDGIANPVVALQGSGIADAPHIVIHLNTTGCVAPNSLNLSYDLRDIDGSTDNAVQPVALHYRVGGAGNYTNEPSGFVADATTGPVLTTALTPISLTLPAGLLGQAQVQLRIMTTNAVGNDEWVGVDNISVVCGSPSAANASLGGRVTGPNGTGLAKARIEISGGALTQPVFALTNAFGYYSVGDLPTGQSYTVTVSVKGRTFARPTRVVNLGDDLTNVDFASIE